MNVETVKSVCNDDYPQKVRNALTISTNVKDATTLKENIDKFLWNNLPMKTTLREAEIMSCKIFSIINE